jgi:hypothetical protein
MSDANLKQRLLLFLSTKANFKFINFAMPSQVHRPLWYKVYPQAYYRDVYEAIKNDDVEVEQKKLPAGIPARYWSRVGPWDDELQVSPLFNLNNPFWQMILVHECTHIHIDIQGIGKHSTAEGEALAYTAGAVYLSAGGLKKGKEKDPILQNIYQTADGIASKILHGTYRVSAGDTQALVSAILKHPSIQRKSRTPSDGV